MRQFKGNTFVCFIDISGFTQELNKNVNSAGRMLDVFYSAGYNTIKDFKTLNGIFVSDCGIIYSDIGKESDKLENLLGAIKNINKLMLEENYLTTASIAFGFMEYRKKFVFNRITKNAVVGSGYLNAFKDNEDKEIKLCPGQARITKDLQNVIDTNNVFEKIPFEKGNNQYLIETEKHYYFNWLCKDVKDKLNTEEIYLNYKNQTDENKYEILKLVLRKI